MIVIKLVTLRSAAKLDLLFIKLVSSKWDSQLRVTKYIEMIVIKLELSFNFCSIGLGKGVILLCLVLILYNNMRMIFDNNLKFWKSK
jgi:hypothetical protein